MSLRSKLIRLASANPEIRGDVLPLLKQGVAKINLHMLWRTIVEKHEAAEVKDFSNLLKESARYLKSAGFDLDLRRSDLGKSYSGSDGWRLEGNLIIRDRPTNTYQIDDPRKVADWVEQATGLHGTARKLSDGSWNVDISSY